MVSLMAIVTTATRKLLKANKKIRAVSGGTGASKTFSIMMILVDYAQSATNEIIDVISETLPHLEAGAETDFKSILQSRGYWVDSRWNKQKHIYTFETGTTMHFTSMDKIGKAHGPRRDVLFLNECNYMKFDVVHQLILRTRKHVWLDWNPSGDFWFYDEMLGRREDLEFWGEGGSHEPLTFLDNEALSESERHEILLLKESPNKNRWRVYGLGLRGEIEGLIYKDWRQIDEIPPGARLERRWLDFGYTNDPSAIGSVYYFNGEWLLDEELYRKGMSNKQLADFLNSLPKPETTVVADSAEPKSIDEIRSYGVNMVASEKGSDSVRNGIQLVQDQPIAVTKRSLNIIKEQRNYLWFIDKNGRITQDPDPACADHHMDGIRYALSTLGRLKQQADYWDRLYAKELSTVGRPQRTPKNPAI